MWRKLEIGSTVTLLLLIPITNHHCNHHCKVKEATLWWNSNNYLYMYEWGVYFYTHIAPKLDASILYISVSRQFDEGWKLDRPPLRFFSSRSPIISVITSSSSFLFLLLPCFIPLHFGAHTMNATPCMHSMEEMKSVIAIRIFILHTTGVKKSPTLIEQSITEKENGSKKQQGA